MKKSCLLIVFTISYLLGVSQYSSITVDVSDNERAFLDTVEAKLIRHVSQISAHKVDYDINLYTVWPYSPGHWGMCYTRYEVDSTHPTDNRVATYKYGLDMQWDSSLSCAYVYGFSKLYAQPVYQWMGGYYKQAAITEYPIYHIPLSQYHTFLDKQEMNILYSIIKKEFIRYVDDDTIYTQDSLLTYRTINFHKSDSLAQMPWRYWVELSYRGIQNGSLKVYNNFRQTKTMTRFEADSCLLNFITVIDSAGKSSVQVELADEFLGVSVIEKWNFDINGSHFINAIDTNYAIERVKYFMRISRNIETIGIIKDVPINEQRWKKAGANPVWVDAGDIDKMCRNGKLGPLYLYKTLINSALYKKLNLRYRPWY